MFIESATILFTPDPIWLVRHVTQGNQSIMQLQTTETDEFESADEIVPAFAEQYMTTTEAVLALTARKLLDALESLHNAGMVHCALTPWSFDFTNDGVEFTDLLWAHDVSGEALSPELSEIYPNFVPRDIEDFIAPEIWYGKKPSQLSDMYSFGATLFYLATGETLGQTRLANFSELAAQTLSALQPQLGQSFCQAICDLLSLDAEKRPTVQTLRSIMNATIASSRAKSFTYMDSVA